MRFLFPGGQYTLIIDGMGISISAVGNGKITAIAAGTSDDGSFTVDGNRAHIAHHGGADFSLVREGRHWQRRRQPPHQ